MLCKSAYSVSIKAVGDICPGDKSIMGLGVLRETRRNGVDFPFDKVRGLVQRGDIVLGNLEGLLTHKVKEKRRSALTFCGLPEFANAMVRLGFTVVNVANNHILEHGPGMFIETINNLTEAGLKICGLRSKSDKYYSRPVVLSINGQCLGILGYNWVGVDRLLEADQFIAQSHDSIVNYTWNRHGRYGETLRNLVRQKNKNVISDIKTLKKEVNYVLLMAHWGFEFVNYPPYGLTLEAKSFVDAGADVIVGSHPHVLQGVEEYGGKLIFYSLGNFVFDSRNEETKFSSILCLNIDENRNASHHFQPVYINKHFQPEIANPKQKTIIDSIITTSNRFINSPQRSKMLNDNAVYKQYEHYYRSAKFGTVLRHILALTEDPYVIFIILRKIANFAKVLLARMKGQRIRW